jgi:hypothetical protein
MPTVTFPEASARPLRDFVEEALGGGRIRDVELRPPDRPGWYGSQIVTVTLCRGESVRLFLKDFGSYARAKEGMPERRERELLLYRDLLSRAGLGTARYVGSHWDDDAARFWLLLEYVEGLPVKHCEFRYWALAAAWLGRMHAWSAAHPTLWTGRRVLLHRDAPFVESTAAAALRSVHQISPGLGARLARAAGTYEPVTRAMQHSPRTLLHGAYLPAQILLDPSGEAPRVCPLDWELAGIGPCWYDLAFLADGFTGDRLDEVVEAYRREALALGFPVPDAEELEYQVACGRLLKTLQSLALAAGREYREKDVSRMVETAVQVAARLA